MTLGLQAPLSTRRAGAFRRRSRRRKQAIPPDTDLPGMPPSKTCTRCGTTQPLSAFYKRSDPEVAAYEDTDPRKYRAACKVCVRPKSTESSRARKAAQARERRAADPTIGHRSVLRQHGITPDWYAASLAAQGGGCAICSKTEAENGRRLAVDHDHRHCPGAWGCPECVRGLLCVHCNAGVGYLGDAADRLRAAADYLERHA